jgi:hypothetical protein
MFNGSLAQRTSYGTLMLLQLALHFSPAVGLIGFVVTGSFLWSFSGVARDVLIVILVLLIALMSAIGRASIAKWSSIRWSGFLAACLIAIALLTSTDAAAAALNLRRMVLFPALFVCAALAPLTPTHVHHLFAAFLSLTLAICIAGCVEYLLPNAFWTDILRVQDYFAANPLDPFGMLPFEETGRFFSWDLEQWLGGPIRRSVSTYLEPTTYAAALMTALAIGLNWSPRYRRMSYGPWPFIALAGLITVSKAFLIAFLLCFFHRWTNRPRSGDLLPILLFGGGAAFGMVAVGATEGKFEHVTGLTTAIGHVLNGAYFGEGVGNAGNYAAADSDLTVGAESGLGNLLAQTGIVGLIYLVWIASLLRDINAQGRKIGAQRLASGLVLATYAWLISFLFSASSMGVGGNAFLFLLAGLFLNRSAAGSFHENTIPHVASPVRAPKRRGGLLSASVSPAQRTGS